MPRQQAFFRRSRQLQYSLPILFVELVFATTLWALVAGAEGDERVAILGAIAGVLLAIATVQLILTILLFATAARPEWAVPPADKNTDPDGGWLEYQSLLRTGVWMFRISVVAAACWISYVYDVANQLILNTEFDIRVTLARAALISLIPMAARFLELCTFALYEASAEGSKLRKGYDRCRKAQQLLPFVSVAAVAVLLVGFLAAAASSSDRGPAVDLYDSWGEVLLLGPPIALFGVMELTIGSDVIRHLHDIVIDLNIRLRRRGSPSPDSPPAGGTEQPAPAPRQPDTGAPGTTAGTPRRPPPVGSPSDTGASDTAATGTSEPRSDRRDIDAPDTLTTQAPPPPPAEANPSGTAGADVVDLVKEETKIQKGKKK